MSRRDTFHYHCREALEKDGWTITDDPYLLKFTDSQSRNRDYPIDLGAEKLIAAEKGPEKIAVEIKTFGGSSTIDDYHKALGQYMDYLLGLKLQEPERKLYVAVTVQAFKEIQANPLAKLSVEHYKLPLILFDSTSKTIKQWVK